MIQSLCGLVVIVNITPWYHTHRPLVVRHRHGLKYVVVTLLAWCFNFDCALKERANDVIRGVNHRPVALAYLYELYSVIVQSHVIFC